MSLLISMCVPDCIVVAADSCMTTTTTKNKDTENAQVTAMSYYQGRPKIVVFRERLVVTYCGNMNVNKNLTVFQFLTDLRASVSKNISPGLLSEEILKQYGLLSDGGSRTTFLISGYVGTDLFVFRVYSDSNDVVCEWSNGQFGASFSGMTEYVKPILNSVANYKLFGVRDAVELVSSVMDCMCTMSRFWESQSISPPVDIYLIYRDKSEKSGWIRCGQAVPVIPYKYKPIKF